MYIYICINCTFKFYTLLFENRNEEVVLVFWLIAHTDYQNSKAFFPHHIVWCLVGFFLYLHMYIWHNIKCYVKFHTSELHFQLPSSVNFRYGTVFPLQSLTFNIWI